MEKYTIKDVNDAPIGTFITISTGEQLVKINDNNLISSNDTYRIEDINDNDIMEVKIPKGYTTKFQRKITKTDAIKHIEDLINASDIEFTGEELLSIKMALKALKNEED